MRAGPPTCSGSGRFLGGYRHTALDCDDAMVLGVGEFRAEEQVVCRQVQVEASEGRHMEVAGVGGEVEHVSADAAILAQEMEVKARDRDALIDRRRPESDHRAADVARHRLDLVTRDLGEPRERMMLTRRDPHADLRQHAVEAHGVEEVPAREFGAVRCWPPSENGEQCEEFGGDT
jgi:hypothetical protein